jgi:hypothetical protein
MLAGMHDLACYQCWACCRTICRVVVHCSLMMRLGCWEEAVKMTIQLSVGLCWHCDVYVQPEYDRAEGSLLQSKSMYISTVC